MYVALAETVALRADSVEELGELHPCAILLPSRCVRHEQNIAGFGLLPLLQRPGCLRATNQRERERGGGEGGERGERGGERGGGGGGG